MKHDKNCYMSHRNQVLLNKVLRTQITPFLATMVFSIRPIFRPFFLGWASFLIAHCLQQMIAPRTEGSALQLMFGEILKYATFCLITYLNLQLFPTGWPWMVSGVMVGQALFFFSCFALGDPDVR